jgi:hypothetical protein
MGTPVCEVVEAYSILCYMFMYSLFQKKNIKNIEMKYVNMNDKF